MGPNTNTCIYSHFDIYPEDSALDYSPWDKVVVPVSSCPGRKWSLWVVVLVDIGLGGQVYRLSPQKNYNQTFSINSFQNCELIWRCFRIMKLWLIICIFFLLGVSYFPSIHVLTEERLALHIEHRIPHSFWMVYMCTVQPKRNARAI